MFFGNQVQSFLVVPFLSYFYSDQDNSISSQLYSNYIPKTNVYLAATELFKERFNRRTLEKLDEGQNWWAGRTLRGKFDLDPQTRQK